MTAYESVSYSVSVAGLHGVIPDDLSAHVINLCHNATKMEGCVYTHQMLLPLFQRLNTKLAVAYVT